MTIAEGYILFAREKARMKNDTGRYESMYQHLYSYVARRQRVYYPVYTYVSAYSGAASCDSTTLGEISSVAPPTMNNDEVSCIHV